MRVTISMQTTMMIRDDKSEKKIVVRSAKEDKVTRHHQRVEKAKRDDISVVTTDNEKYSRMTIFPDCLNCQRFVSSSLSMYPRLFHIDDGNICYRINSLMKLIFHDSSLIDSRGWHANQSFIFILFE